MNDDIIRMAREADIDPHDMCEDPRIAEHSLERFFHMAQASEREACAKIEEKLACSPAMFATMAQYRVHKDAVIAYRNLILARGQT